jgi:DNA polymerase III gamma/tau subunit
MLWEKYRPRNIRDLINNDNITFTTYKIFKKIGIINILVWGSSGTGKTTFIFSLLNELTFFRYNFYFFKICSITETKKIKKQNFNTKFLCFSTKHRIYNKLYIIDNCDYLSFINQLFLKYYLENFYLFLNFWIICKSISKINAGISSLCLYIHLKKQGYLSITVRFKEIIEKENIFIFLETLDKLIMLGNFNFNFYFQIYVENFSLKVNKQILSLIFETNFIFQLNLQFFKDIFMKDKEISRIRKTFFKKNYLRFIKSESSKYWFFIHNFNLFLE